MDSGSNSLDSIEMQQTSENDGFLGYYFLKVWNEKHSETKKKSRNRRQLTFLAAVFAQVPGLNSTLILDTFDINI